MAICFVGIADGIAMLLPGPSSALGGAAIVVLGAAGLVFGLPRFLSPAGKPFGIILASRFGLVVLPVLVGPVAWLWSAATPEALSWWFAVAWLVTWLGCVGLSAFLPCPRCGEAFGRKGAAFQVASDGCAHCGANARGTMEKRT